jgi:SsrA-binding protein
LFLLGSHFSPLTAASTHVEAEPLRSRKLLMTAKEISYLIGKTQQVGLTLVPLNLHLVRGKIKILVGLARGKKKHDKRDALQKRDWQRQQQRILKNQY